jgi:UDP-hydrolysing UDP-N-acetyl-D-glucosamine 2-epimerase
MKKICIVTATRSEYGLLRWLIDEVANDELLTLQLVVTGAHLEPEFGFTYREIEKDGYKIDEKINISITSSIKGIVKSMGVCSIGFAKAFSRLKPDIVVVLGDRYELLPICSAALIMGIPIAHISGGDITEGAIDDQVRNAVTMMASVHLPGVKASAERIERMTGTSKNIFTVGEPGLDNFYRLKLWNRQKLAEELSLESSKKWVLLTYHPETKLGLKENLFAVKNIIESLNLKNDVQVIITGANSDFGGKKINELFAQTSKIDSLKYKFYISLGQLRYLSVMKEVEFVIGNSSSAIFEAPFLKKPAINVGNRQKGRYLCGNIISSTADYNSLVQSINAIQTKTLDFSDANYYGNGNATILILDKIKNFIF